MSDFAEHGKQVDPKDQIVRISPDLFLEAISHAPRTYTLPGRAEGTDLIIDRTSSYFLTLKVHTIITQGEMLPNILMLHNGVNI
ncbi:hypothetical protein ACFLY4_05085 [Chloroflexota bacterium]